MKNEIAVLLVAALALSGCAPQAEATKQQRASVSADQAVVADQEPALKKKCSNQTGSRLAPCGDGATGDYVQGASGDAYRQTSAVTRPTTSPH